MLSQHKKSSTLTLLVAEIFFARTKPLQENLPSIFKFTFTLTLPVKFKSEEESSVSVSVS